LVMREYGTLPSLEMVAREDVGVFMGIVSSTVKWRRIAASLHQ